MNVIFIKNNVFKVKSLEKKYYLVRGEIKKYIYILKNKFE